MKIDVDKKAKQSLQIDNPMQHRIRKDNTTTIRKLRERERSRKVQRD